MRAASFLVSGILLFTPAAYAQTDCATVLNEARSLARDVTATVEAPARPAIGAPIRVRWTSRNQQGRARALPPLYLVVTTPADVRFSGTGFIALTAGAKGPEGLAYGNNGARALVPLHRTGSGGGEIGVKLYRAGRSALGWAVVTAGACGEQVLAHAQTSVTIPPGAPELVLQERFQTEQPLRRIRARSGRHDLLVFKDRYEVHEVATGAKIIERPGNDPNFSPTGRFVAARGATGGELEVVDLISGGTAASFNSGTLSWARGDSFAVHGGLGNGNIEVFNALVDKSQISWVGGMSTLSCRVCGGWGDVDLVLDIDRGYVAAVGPLGGKYADLFTRQDWNATERMGDPKTKEPQKRIVETGIRQRFNPDLQGFPRGWNFVGEKVAFSHLVDHGLSVRPPPVDPEEQGTLVTHPNVPNNAVAANAQSRTVGDTLVPANTSSRGLARAVQGPPGKLTPPTVFAHLANAGVATVALRQGSRADRKPELDSMINDMTRRVVDARSTVREPPKIFECTFDQTPQTSGIEIVPSWVARSYHWKRPEGSIWLLQELCYAGSAQFLNQESVVLVTETGTKKIHSILEVLGNTFGGSTAQFHEANKVLAFADESERLIVMSPLGKSAGVVDIKTARREGVAVSLANSDLILELRRTVDGKYLVQLNTDGGFLIYRLSDGKRMLRGAIVDDEVIVTTDDGLYDTTYEGAHAVQVRFGGLPGLFSFHQFESTLRRQGLAKSVLEGTSVAPAPAVLPVPPQVALTLAAAAKDGKRAAKVVATSERELKEVRLYVDGRVVETLAVQGARLESTVDLLDPGGGRWITAVAIDANGLVSLPSAIQVPGAVRPRGTLRALIAGVDNYSDPAFEPLKSAKRDARSFAAALESVGKRVFASFDPPKLLVDAQVTQFKVLLSAADAAQKTGPDDTLVLFFAGHGVDATGLSNPDVGLALATGATRVNALDRTAISWSAIADAVKDARGKVVVVIDACHSGLAGHGALATNDAMVGTLFTHAGAPMVVLAASKGRQLSHETAEGGRFTNALVAALTSDRGSVDRDRSGLVDLGELYAAVKGRVVAGTEGAQTPWLARNGLVGEMSLF